MAATDPLLQSASHSVGNWIDQAVAAGWLPSNAPQRLESLTVATPAELFDDTERPLVVGLFGGTGVGKSTLLNRIAGQNIARASAERPTSTAVTAYLHHSRRIDRLPAEFPMERLATSLHHEHQWRDVLWLDMPDVDSVEQQHRELVLQWLPHTDVLLYVVNPERYKDSSGWTLLREHCRDHAWMFVFNQRDRGTNDQIEDLRRLLSGTGFADPAVFATSSAPGAEDPSDDFGELLAQLVELSDRRLIDDLAQRGVAERLTQVYALADELATPALRASAQGALPTHWQQAWSVEAEGLRNSLEGRVPVVVQQLSDTALPEEAAAALIDEQALARIDGVLSAKLLELDSAGVLPRSAAQKAFGDWRAELPQRLISETASAVGQSLANPGTPWQRFAQRALTTLSVLLPTAALAWAGWRILAAFRAGATDPSAYLGVNFAVTAVLLIGISWALPWWLARRSAPSSAATYRRGLTQGVTAVLAHVEQGVARRFQNLEESRSALIETLHAARAQTGNTLLPGADAAQRASSLPESLRRLVSTSEA